MFQNTEQFKNCRYIVSVEKDNLAICDYMKKSSSTRSREKGQCAVQVLERSRVSGRDDGLSEGNIGAEWLRRVRGTHRC